MATGHFDYINSKRIPYPNREYVESFTGLAGGVNTYDQPFNLKSNEAAMMQNLSWRAGVLGCRRGQVQKPSTGDGHTGLYELPKQTNLGYDIHYLTVAPFLFNGWMLVQAFTQDPLTSEPLRFYAVKIEDVIDPVTRYEGFVEKISVPASQCNKPGIFFQYRESVFFKGEGVYLEFVMNPNADQVLWSTRGIYVPVIAIGADPATGASVGGIYQQENRLTSAKKIVFSVTADNTTTFQLPYTNLVGTVNAWAVLTPEDAMKDNPGTQLAIDTANTNLTTGTIVLQAGQSAGTNVTIQFHTNNQDALNSIMYSKAAIVFGGTQELCVVLGNTPAQPNAYFWSGNDGTVMNPTYFPMNQYNLAGDNDEPITCFGKQQNMLVIFQPNATGRAVFGTETIMGYVQVTMNYTRINAEIGCDLPGSLQLVQNNLVWANRKYGVCRLKDSSAAYENNITVLSRKINGGRYNFPGLLEGIANIESADDVRSTDTGTRYILTVGTDAYEWNYELSSHEDPSWFLHTNIYGVGFVPLANDVLYEVTTGGKIATFEDGVFADFGEAIEKQYRFPPRNFGTYDRLKNIVSAIFTVRADTNQNTQLLYICDYAQRYDPTNMVVIATTEDSGRPFAIPFRRKPGYHNIKHLQTVLYNNEVGKDMSIIDATIFYTLRGRLR